MNMHRRKWVATSGVRLSLLLALSMAMAGCGSLVDTNRPADDRYWLEPLPAQAGEASGGALSLQLAVVPGLDTEQVLVLGPGARLGQLEQARWADNLPEVLASVLKRSLENNGFSVANRPGRSAAGACELVLEVREFFARADASGVNDVRASLSGVLHCAGKRSVIGLSAAPRAGQGAAATVEALQRALNEVTISLLRQLEVARLPASAQLSGS